MHAHAPPKRKNVRITFHFYKLVLESTLPIDDTEYYNISLPTYHTWLQEWNKHMEGAPTLMIVPASARLIHTPLVVLKWFEALQIYPLEELAEFFLSGIQYGFRIGYNNPTASLKRAHKNLEGALLNPEVIDDYLKAEVVNHRMAGPFSKILCQNTQIS